MTEMRDWLGGPVVGDDGLVRCPWAGGDPLNRDYHDQEWGMPVHGEDALFERITLEAFQSGLSWLTILRKRPAFRAAFAGFDADCRGRVHRGRRGAADGRHGHRAQPGQDPGHAAERPGDRRAAVATAASMRGSGRIVPDTPGRAADGRRHAQPRRRRRGRWRRTSVSHGFVFVGPTTAWALMQAIGLVDDHLVGCLRRGAAGTAGRT